MTEITPLISVCIANYNGIDLIDACIASVLNQTSQFPLEIIVHDDASPDGSADYIRGKYPTVQLIESQENVGFCIANNRMVAQAKGRYVLLLNNDATLWPDALAALEQEAERLQRPAILTLPQYDNDSGTLLDIGSRLDPFLNPVPNLDPTRNDVGTVAGACLWIDKILWEELGGFPEWFGSIGEDLYLCCRARLMGYPVRALGVSGYRHRVGASFGGGKARGGKLSTTYRRRALSERNKTFVMVLTYPTPLFHLVFAFHIPLLLVEGLTLACIKREWKLFHNIYLACFKALWHERGRIGHLRKKIQADKRIGLPLFWAVYQASPHKLTMFLRHGLPNLK